MTRTQFWNQAQIAKTSFFTTTRLSLRTWFSWVGVGTVGFIAIGGMLGGIWLMVFTFLAGIFWNDGYHFWKDDVVLKDLDRRQARIARIVLPGVCGHFGVDHQQSSQTRPPDACSYCPCPHFAVGPA